MKQKKWFSYCSIILCILIAVPHNTGGMQLTIDVLRELAPLVARATASLCMYAAASKQSFIHNYLHHNAQLQQVASSYNPHTWDTIQSLQEVNHTILTNNCTASYDLIHPTAPDLPPIEITSAPEQSNYETAYHTEPLDCSAISYYVPSAHQLSLKAPPLPDTQHHIQVMCTAQKRTGMDHLQQAEIDYKAHKDYYAHTLSYDNQECAQFYGHLHFIQDVVAHCNDPDYITRIKARLLCPDIYNKDFFFDDHSWIVANSLSHRYFNHSGALINIDDDPDLSWTIFPFADEIFNGHHLMPTLIDPHCCSTWQQLVHYVGGCTKLLIQRGCERFLGPTAQSVRENQYNLHLLHLINLCERYEWEQAEQYLQQQTHHPDQFIFLDTIYRTIKKQRINKYYITVNANDDSAWIHLSDATKKIISNNFELRKLCNTYFLARHELRKLGKNPDDYELAINNQAIGQYVKNFTQEQQTKKQKTIVEPVIQSTDNGYSHDTPQKERTSIPVAGGGGPPDPPDDGNSRTNSDKNPFKDPGGPLHNDDNEEDEEELKDDNNYDEDISTDEIPLEQTEQALKAAEKLKKVPGINENNGPLSKINTSKNSIVIQGATYELQVALHLSKKELISFFGRILPNGPPEFDLETPTKLIECKSWNWKNISTNQIEKFKSTIPAQKIKATIAKKEFILYTRKKPPKDIMQWLTKKGIKVIKYCVKI